ncbi:MAG: hypothetical protein UU67_C0042G0013 [Candidatus Daviesbacteria bacterium GW2011_GWB1_41_5]|uniref:Uncharacterized protein n=1 Tax=Candidatus Daviesbacteria bacterium GW2011_GWB1_41_5 TaxID=1618429 RepID=A0A0G0WL16_9BACT|nr:MAG: hypothetical protein UU67_C0042G0013 [Candidatus Daviesbacteria bacterium GW2011_GWB1_41_5]
MAMMWKVLIETAVFIEAQDALGATERVEAVIREAQGLGDIAQQIVENSQVITAEGEE